MSEIVILVTQLVTTTALVFTLWLAFKEFQRSNKVRKQESYARLELASIELFKMAIDNPKLENIYSDQIDGNLSNTEHKHYLEYYACLLNLFEIHFNLRMAKDIEPVIFATWIPWLYDLCESAYFRKAWKNLQKHYVPKFREYINSLMNAIDKADAPQKEQIFYNEASRLMGDDKIIKNWIKGMR